MRDALEMTRLISRIVADLSLDNGGRSRSFLQRDKNEVLSPIFIGRARECRSGWAEAARRSAVGGGAKQRRRETAESALAAVEISDCHGKSGRSEVRPHRVEKRELGVGAFP